MMMMMRGLVWLTLIGDSSLVQTRGLTHTVSPPPSLLRPQVVFRKLLAFNDLIILPHDSHNSQKAAVRKSVMLYLRKRLATAELDTHHKDQNLDYVLLILKSLLTHALKEKQLVLYHDAQSLSLTVLGRLTTSLATTSSVLILDITQASLRSENWMGNYNDAMFVHILLFEDSYSVEDFADSLTPRIWRPTYFLLVSLNSTSSTPVLHHPRLNRCPFLSLLQPPFSGDASSRYLIITRESFRKRGKIRTRGSYRPGESLSLQDLFPDRFPSFQGHHFHLTSWPSDYPFLHGTAGAGDMQGICYRMLEESSHRLNFTFQVYASPPDMKWGDYHNGTWRGMIGEVYREEKDFGINQMGMLRDRNAAIDFGVPYWVEGYTFLLPLPAPPPRWWSMSFPFSWVTWVVVMATLLVVTALHLFFIRVKNLGKGGVARTLLEVTKTILRQDASDLSSYDSIRVFQGVWRVAAMVISISYTGNLVAYITIPPRPVLIGTFADLARSSLKPFMVDYGSYVITNMATSLNPDVSKVGQKVESIPYDYELAYSMVKEGGHAMLETLSYAQYGVIKYRVHHTYFLKSMYQAVNLAWFFPKHTPWKHKVDSFVSSFLTYGHCLHWKKELNEWFRGQMPEENQTDTGRIQSQIDPDNRPLSLADCQGAFLVYGVCGAAAVLAFILELLCPVSIGRSHSREQ